MSDKQLSAIQAESTIADRQPDYAIQTQRLMKVYKTAAGDYAALKGIDLQVPHGEFVAALSQPSAGKSTIVNLVTGIDRATSGE